MANLIKLKSLSLIWINSSDNFKVQSIFNYSILLHFRIIESIKLS
jgi:hypothetical protein